MLQRTAAGLAANHDLRGQALVQNVLRRFAMLVFENRPLRALPVDPVEDNRVRQVFGACFSRVKPTPVSDPSTLAVAHEVAELLEIPEQYWSGPEFARVFAGNQLLPGMDPWAACYGGHQFGSWAGQLGDGRAITLGEVRTSRGEHFEVQLKGAGPTPYSRRADGRAVLRSSLREFLCSEAMHHLGIPTTRALSLVATGDAVLRDILYDGHPRLEPGAVVCRVAPSFLRFGNYELFAFREEHDVLRKLVDFTIATYFPELGTPSPATYCAWFAEVTRRTAELMASWMAVGFVHGVMNTDNMSVLGLTIDYGPYGFLDDYSPDWTPNITDAEGRRYRYINQPRIALWNLVCLANAVFPLVGEAEPLQAELARYGEMYEAARARLLAGKLGLKELSEDELDANGTPRTPDSNLVTELFDVLASVETDLTLFFRSLADVPSSAELGDEALLAKVRGAYYDASHADGEPGRRLTAWLRRYQRRLREERRDDQERRAAMNRVNPRYVLRNYLAQEAIDLAEQGDASRLVELLEVVRRPFDDQPEKAHFAAKRPDWARQRAGCSMLSCSS